MLVSLEEAKTEALKRMEKMQLEEHCIAAFRDNDRVWFSERQNSFFDGILYDINDDNQDVLDKIEELKKDNKLVYHIQLTHTEIGDMWNMLYVDLDNKEWDQDRIDLDNKEQLVYVYLPNDSIDSEYGYIGIKSKNGGITRTY